MGGSMSIALAKSFAAEPVVSYECDEPEGLVTREVWPMKFTPLNLKIFWERAKRYKVLFHTDVSNDFKKFMEIFVREGVNGLEPQGLIWVIDDFIGVFYMTAIELGVDALVHYSFFDGRHTGRVNLTRAMLRYGFEYGQFRRLSAIVPMFVPQALLFAEQIGFKHEGRK